MIINDSQEIAAPPFSIIYLEINGSDDDDLKKPTKLFVRFEHQNLVIFNGNLSDQNRGTILSS
ncbi:MAG: hypothetical protein WBL67_22145 [Nitrososphaeraceae archaeon]